jgi:HTH-type transcriptional regulator / antitoxin MqsA
MTDHPETMISDQGRTLRRGVRPLTVIYKGLSKTVDMPGWYPEDADDDDDAVFVGSDMDASDAALRELKERTDRIPRPETVRRIREKLGLSQRKASALLGGGPNAFQKYESAEAEPSQAMGVLLFLLDQHPDLLKDVPPPLAP